MHAITLRPVPFAIESLYADKSLSVTSWFNSAIPTELVIPTPSIEYIVLLITYFQWLSYNMSGF